MLMCREHKWQHCAGGLQQLPLNANILTFAVGLGGFTCTAEARLAALCRWATRDVKRVSGLACTAEARLAAFCRWACATKEGGWPNLAQHLEGVVLDKGGLASLVHCVGAELLQGEPAGKGHLRVAGIILQGQQPPGSAG